MTDFTRAAKLRELRAKTDRELMILAERLAERARTSGGEADLRKAQSLMALAGREQSTRPAATPGRAAGARSGCMAACC